MKSLVGFLWVFVCQYPLAELIDEDALFHGESTVSVNRAGKPLTGAVIETYPSGALYRRGAYSNGRKEGLWEEFHVNGRLAYKERWKAGKPHGLWEWFHENGQLWGGRMYQNGKEHGLLQWFDGDGNLEETEAYKNGELEYKIREDAG